MFSPSRVHQALRRCKEIQETLGPAERIELAGLTGIMREHLESEANVPMEGAKALHRKLLELAAEDEPT